MSNKVTETKGYLAIRGKIFGLDNKEPFESDYKRNLGFGISTNKENGIFVTVGGWKNSSMTVNIKGEGMDKPVKIEEQEAIEEIQGLFKNGDSVFVGLRAEFNTYSKRIDYIINKIYILDEELDFVSKDFEEKNELDVPAIIVGKPEDKKLTVAFATYQGQVYETELTIKDNDIEDFFTQNTDIGDIVPVMLKVIRTPIREEVKEEKEDKPTEAKRKTFKGKEVGGTQKSKRGKITGYVEELEIVDIDLEKIQPSVYTLKDLGFEGGEDVEMPF